MNEREALVACPHHRYSIETHTQTGRCCDCGATGKMRFIADGDTAPQQEPVAQIDLAERIAKKIAPAIRRCDTDTVQQAIRSGILEALQSAPQPADGIALQELRNMANSKRFNRENFRDDTEWADWAQNRARHAITRAEREPDQA